MTFRNNLKFISWTIILFSTPIILFLVFLIKSYLDSGSFQWAKTAIPFAGIFGLISLMTFPGFLLHYKYYQQDKGKFLRFRPTYLEINDITGLNKIYYKDILKVEKHYVSWNRSNPWSEYGYNKIFLKNDVAFTYNCLTHDYLSSAILFKIKNVVVEDYDELFPW